MVSAPDVDDNLVVAHGLLEDAAADGTRLIVLPENFAQMPRAEKDRLDIAETPGDGPIQSFLAQRAADLELWIVGGTIALRTETGDKITASCLVYDDTGQQVARYDKQHLFDVVVDEASGEAYTESDTIASGNEVVVIDSPVGRLGLAVCYDLRFPELFRAMSAQGAEIFVIPSAFTAATGRAHWEMLLRARAVENLAFVIAPNQGGQHDSGRQTWGHSMIVDPWGVILDQVTIDNDIAMADIDLDHLRSIRKRFPVLDHRRL